MHPTHQASFLCSLPTPKALEEWCRSRAGALPLLALCLCGRSNVGKSSLINALFGPRRAKTSKTPGKTRSIVVFSLAGGRYLFDLPGFGHARIPRQTHKQWEALMMAFFDRLGVGLLVLHIQDARHPGTSKDREFEDFLAERAPTARRVALFNKIDKLSHSSLLELKRASSREAFFCSARDGSGVDGVREFLMGGDRLAGGQGT